MFRFGKPSRDSATEAGEDLLAHSEQEEFDSSVRAARERVTGRIGAAEAEEKPSAAGDADTEIVWSEQPDVYRPRRIDAREYLRSQALEPAVQLLRDHGRAKALADLLVRTQVQDLVTLYFLHGVAPSESP